MHYSTDLMELSLEVRACANLSCCGVVTVYRPFNSTFDLMAGWGSAFVGAGIRSHGDIVCKKS